MKTLAAGCWHHRCEIAETVASSHVSAACYGFAEHVFILPMIEAKGKFVQVQRQILFAHMMIAAHHATFEQRPERFNRVGMDRANYVLILTMLDDSVGHPAVRDGVITAMLIRCDQCDLLRDHLANKSHHGRAICVSDHLTNDIALAR